MSDESQDDKQIKYAEQLLELLRAMFADGISQEQAAGLFDKMAALCRPKYVVTRERASVFNNIVPEDARKALGTWARSIAHLGGAATKGLTTERKAKSSRENGKKGGRPRKIQS